MRPGEGHLAALANLLEIGEADPGDVRYPLYLINGRPPEDPYGSSVRRGERLRLRLINISGDTFFCFFVEGHPVTVVASDGQLVEPIQTDAVVLGMGERCDVLLEADRPGAYRMIGMPLGKEGRAVATLRYADAASATMPTAEAPIRMPPRIASYEDLRDVEPAEPLESAREVSLDLGLREGEFVWTMGGQAFPDSETIRLARDEQVRIMMRNDTMMPHPMHLHGHVFVPVLPGGRGPRKDTFTVGPMQTAAMELVADNPGTWAFHCHNVYHQEAGMMRAFEVGS